MSYPDFLLDKRVIQRNISKGVVDKTEYAKHLKALNDVEHNAEPCVLEEPEDTSADESESSNDDTPPLGL